MQNGIFSLESESNLSETFPEEVWKKEVNLLFSWQLRNKVTRRWRKSLMASKTGSIHILALV